MVGKTRLLLVASCQVILTVSQPLQTTTDTWNYLLRNSVRRSRSALLERRGPMASLFKSSLASAHYRSKLSKYRCDKIKKPFKYSLGMRLILMYQETPLVCTQTVHLPLRGVLVAECGHTIALGWHKSPSKHYLYSFLCLGTSKVLLSGATTVAEPRRCGSAHSAVDQAQQVPELFAYSASYASFSTEEAWCACGLSSIHGRRGKPAGRDPCGHQLQLRAQKDVYHWKARSPQT